MDVVLDRIGGETQQRSWRVLCRGVLISIVSPVAAEKAASLGGLRGAFFIVQPNRAQLIQLGNLIDEGTLRVVVGAVLPLARAREAFQQASAGHKPGKPVLQVAAAESAKA